MKTNTDIKAQLNSLHLSDVYSLMLFILYKIDDIPEYATLSELCYLLDGNNMTRLLTYFAGKTVRIPTQEEFVFLVNALTMYQRVNLNGESFVEARNKISNVTAKQRDQITDLYLKIIPILDQYNIDRSQISKYVR